MEQINFAHTDIFHNKEYWVKIGMEFLRLILGKIESICQQPAMPHLSGVRLVLKPITCGPLCASCCLF